MGWLMAFAEMLKNCGIPFPVAVIIASQLAICMGFVTVLMADEVIERANKYDKR